MSDRAAVSHHIWEGWFTITTPSMWSQEEQNGVILLCDDEHGAGALQLSLATRNKSEPASPDEAEALARRFAAGCGWRPDSFERIRLAGSAACRFTYVEPTSPPTFWEVWKIVDDSRAATITYNCFAEDEPAEREVRHSVVSSFRWLPRTD